MKETGTNISTGLNHGGNPRGVATRRDGFHLSEARAKMVHNAMKLFRTLCDEPGIDIFRMLSDQALDLGLQRSYLDCVEGHLPLAFSRPVRGAVECRRAYVGCEK